MKPSTDLFLKVEYGYLSVRLSPERCRKEAINSQLKITFIFTTFQALDVLQSQKLFPICMKISKMKGIIDNAQ